jgi:hypothetical protein
MRNLCGGPFDSQTQTEEKELDAALTLSYSGLSDEPTVSRMGSNTLPLSLLILRHSNCTRGLGVALPVPPSAPYQSRAGLDMPKTVSSPTAENHSMLVETCLRSHCLLSNVGAAAACMITGLT